MLKKVVQFALTKKAINIILAMYCSPKIIFMVPIYYHKYYFIIMLQFKNDTSFWTSPFCTKDAFSFETRIRSHTGPGWCFSVRKLRVFSTKRAATFFKASKLKFWIWYYGCSSGSGKLFKLTVQHAYFRVVCYYSKCSTKQLVFIIIPQAENYSRNPWLCSILWLIIVFF